MLRADEKIKYGEIHLNELKNKIREKSAITTGDPWENAHIESCMYHLAGAVEAILHEINIGYSLNLRLQNVTWDKVEKILKKTGEQSKAFEYLQRSKKSEPWLILLFNLRNYGTHRRRTPKNISFSEAYPEFIDPTTNPPQPQHAYPKANTVAVLENFVNDVTDLVHDCRKMDSRL